MTRPSRPYAAALAVAALASVAVPGAGLAESAFSRQEYFELVRRYARGERAEAVAALGAWSERDLARQLASVEQAARAAERCPSCPNSISGLPLRAAVMLHWDRDRAEQSSPEGVEQVRRCPGPLARLAGRFARLLSLRSTTADFARGFFRMAVTSCQWDACFEAAERWASEGIEVFPRDPELLLARGSVREESALLGSVSFTAESEASALRQAGLQKARRDFEDALSIDPDVVVARLRLGRVLWRLGEPEPARRQLEVALQSPLQGDHAYLAHLFLGRVYQDAGRLEDAASEYRLAMAVHPSALSAGVALSHALFLAGDAEGARPALRQALRNAGRRLERDPHWDYVVLNASDLEALSEDLHRESLEWTP